MTPTTKTATPKFVDAAGRTWWVKLNIGLAQQIRDQLDVDFGDLQDGRLFLTLGNDPYKLGAVLWMLCEAQAVKIPLTPEEFIASIDGDVIDAALEAIIDATVGFTRAPLRGPLKTVLGKTLEAHAQSLAMVESWTNENAQLLFDQTATKTKGALAELGESLSSSPPS
jgi:hypothetical protein